MGWNDCGGKRRWGVSAPAETITRGRRSQHETTEVCRGTQQERTEKQGDRKTDLAAVTWWMVTNLKTSMCPSPPRRAPWTKTRGLPHRDQVWPNAFSPDHTHHPFRERHRPWRRSRGFPQTAPQASVPAVCVPVDPSAGVSPGPVRALCDSRSVAFWVCMQTRACMTALTRRSRWECSETRRLMVFCPFSTPEEPTRH